MNPIKDPVKDTLVPLRTNLNANGSVRWRTSLYLNVFHWPMGKNSGNGNGVCRYVRAVNVLLESPNHQYYLTSGLHSINNQGPGLIDGYGSTIL